MTVPLKRRFAKSRRGPPTATQAAGVALWRRVADGLERAIADGRYPVGSRLPAEIEIAERLGVNRHTVRRALAKLADRGIVRAERGSGTYVESKRIPYPIRSRTRFSEIMSKNGRQAGGRLIASATEAALPEIAKRLGLKPGVPVIRIDALRHADRNPICIATSWLPADRFPDAPHVYATRRSLTVTLAQFGITDYRRASTRMIASIVEAEDAMWLGLEPGSAVLIVDSVDVDPGGRPIVTSHARFAAERVEFTIES